MNKRVSVKYKLGHTYSFTYEKTKYHCPNCGAKNVWADSCGGDYYVGESHFCVDCSSKFYLPHGAFVVTDSEDLQIIDQLKG